MCKWGCWQRDREGCWDSRGIHEPLCLMPWRLGSKTEQQRLHGASFSESRRGWLGTATARSVLAGCKGNVVTLESPLGGRGVCLVLKHLCFLPEAHGRSHGERSWERCCLVPGFLLTVKAEGIGDLTAKKPWAVQVCGNTQRSPP